jgi:hypothetical protein
VVLVEVLDQVAQVKATQAVQPLRVKALPVAITLLMMRQELQVAEAVQVQQALQARHL